MVHRIAQQLPLWMLVTVQYGNVSAQFYLSCSSFTRKCWVDVAFFKWPIIYLTYEDEPQTNLKLEWVLSYLTLLHYIWGNRSQHSEIVGTKLLISCRSRMRSLDRCWSSYSVPFCLLFSSYSKIAASMIKNNKDMTPWAHKLHCSFSFTYFNIKYLKCTKIK